MIAPGLDHGVEDVADHDDGQGDHGYEDGDQLGLYHLAQDDHLGGRDGGDGHHERQRGAHRQALLDEGLHDGDGAGRIGVQRDSDYDDHGHGEGVAPPGVMGHETRRGVAVYRRPEHDPPEHPGEDPAQDVLGVGESISQALGERDAAGRQLPHLDLVDIVLHLGLQVQPADHGAADDGHHQAQAHVQQGDLYPEQAG